MEQNVNEAIKLTKAESCSSQKANYRDIANGFESLKTMDLG